MKIITSAIIFAASMASNVSYGSYLMAVTFTCSASTSQSGVSSAQSYVVYASGSRGTYPPSTNDNTPCAQAIADQLARGMYLKSSTGVGVYQNPTNGGISTYTEYVFANIKN
jgi:hypothetical protein